MRSWMKWERKLKTREWTNAGLHVKCIQEYLVESYVLTCMVGTVHMQFHVFFFPHPIYHFSVYIC